MNEEEREAYLLEHLEQEHRGLYDWRSMTHATRARLHHAMPHTDANHAHTLTVYVP